MRLKETKGVNRDKANTVVFADATKSNILNLMISMWGRVEFVFAVHNVGWVYSNKNSM